MNKKKKQENGQKRPKLKRIEMREMKIQMKRLILALQ
jgi:hypothetical protein